MASILGNISIKSIRTGRVPELPIEGDFIIDNDVGDYVIFQRTRQVMRLRNYPEPTTLASALTLYSGVVEPTANEIHIIYSNNGIQAVFTRGHIVDEPVLPYNEVPTATVVTFLHQVKIDRPPVPPPVTFTLPAYSGQGQLQIQWAPAQQANAHYTQFYQGFSITRPSDLLLIDPTSLSEEEIKQLVRRKSEEAERKRNAAQPRRFRCQSEYRIQEEQKQELPESKQEQLQVDTGKPTEPVEANDSHFSCITVGAIAGMAAGYLARHYLQFLSSAPVCA